MSRLFAFHTAGPGLTEITGAIARWVGEAGPEDGLLTLLCRHTSASLTIQENADPDVPLDLQDGLARLAPHDPRRYRHGSEGPDDMPAHIRTVLSGVTLSIPVTRGAMSLGTWQGIWLWEHRDRGRRREVAAHLLFSR